MENQKIVERKSPTEFIKSKYTEYLAEFKKIVWPSRNELVKQTLTVVVISLLFGAYTAALDGAFGVGYTFFANFFGK